MSLGTPWQSLPSENAARRFVLAITGASGALYGLRLLDILLEAGHQVDVVISPAGRDVIEQEVGLAIDFHKLDPSPILSWLRDNFGAQRKTEPQHLCHKPSPMQASSAGSKDKVGPLQLWHFEDWGSPLASGSAVRDAMVICPCSVATLAAVVHGMADNLIRRAAEVHLKEHRPLIVVPRETPLSAIQLRNLYRAAKLGIVVLPAMPGFYHHPQSVMDLVDFVVARVCDHLRVTHQLVERWPGRTSLPQHHRRSL